MRKLELNGDVFTLPESWNELTFSQYVFLINLTSKPASVEEIKLKMLLFCMDAHLNRYRQNGSRRYTIQSRKKRYDFSAEEILPVTGIFDYLFQEKDGKTIINPLVTKNFFQTAKCGCRTVYGPAEGMENITYEEFAFLQTYFSMLQSSPEAINQFLSVIYKESNGKSSPAIFNKMTQITKTGILWFYIGCMNFIAGKFPEVFSGGGDSSGSVFDNQMRIIDSLSGNDLTKKDAVKQAKLYDALYTMEIAAENAKKLKNNKLF
jgi:hypothetical protein